jgi:hypothetical protein
MYAMSDDQTRLDALRKGISTAKDEGYVAIRVADLRWLLDQVENRVPEPPLPHDEFKGDLDDPEYDRNRDLD